MTEKDAFLIIAHNEFDVLQRLLSMLDYEEHDVFIHLDRKISRLPILKVSYANLFILEDRIDVRWGHVSQIEVMLKIFGEANQQGKYRYLHLISGVHIPIQPLRLIQEYYEQRKGYSLLNQMQTSEGEIDIKLRKYSFFLKGFMSNSRSSRSIHQLFWKVGHKIQSVFRTKKRVFTNVLKASSWMSLTQEAAAYLVSNRGRILKKYSYTLCGDEFFVATELNNSHLREKVLFDDKLLKCEFVGAGPRVYTLADFENIVASDCLFARKFSHEHMDVVHKIEKILKE